VDIYLMKTKSEVTDKFVKYKAEFEIQNDVLIKGLHTDNGGEYTGNVLKKILGDDVIEQSTTAPYNPASSGIAERINRTLMNAVRVMMNQACVGQEMWGECLLQATYLHNSTPTRSLDEKSPYEKRHGKVPDISRVKIFGCLANVGVMPEKVTSLMTRRCR
jgi:transposase InsO family protein